MRLALWVFAALAAVALVVLIAFQVSPWPRALLIRYTFDQDTAKIVAALEKHVPEGVTGVLDQVYDPSDADARLDVYFPQATTAPLTTVAWVHGGGWISGNEDQIGNYARILASKGFTVVSINYSIAPEKTYPVPLRQVNAALGYLAANAERLHVDTNRLVLAGDSGGAHIASQVANLIKSPAYAQQLGIAPAVGADQLVGTVLFCGAYDMSMADFEGPFGGFLKTVLWSYSGTRDFLTDEGFKTASVIKYVDKDFPPSFISAGNGDPLLPQSLAFADKLRSEGVRVDSLFFAEGHQPPLPHEYQFNLDTEEGQQALERMASFVAGLGPASSSQ